MTQIWLFLKPYSQKYYELELQDKTDQLQTYRVLSINFI